MLSFIDCIMVFGPVIWCRVFAVILPWFLRFFTKVCRVFLPFFAVVFYCPYTAHLVKFCVPKCSSGTYVTLTTCTHTSITEKLISTSDLMKPPHPTISCESEVAMLQQTKRQNNCNTSQNIFSTKYRHHKEYYTATRRIWTFRVLKVCKIMKFEVELELNTQIQ